MKPKNEIIKLIDIHKIYVNTDFTTKVLNGISFSINRGDFVAITGPSGSGKSTLMNIIGLLDTPTTGDYILNNSKVIGLTEDNLSLLRNREIGFVFQSFNLLSRSTALDNVMLPAIYAGVKSNERKKLAIEYLTKVGLIEKLYNRPNQLSGGQQQRVAIARALINNPQIILADEPTGNLDTKSGIDIMNILKKLNEQGKTIIMITHEANIASVAKRIIKMRDGKIVN